MKLTIRTRIALFSFCVFLALLVLESALVLGGLDRALTEVADQNLLDRLEDMSAETRDAGLQEFLEMADDPRTDLSDLIFEILDYLEEEAGGTTNEGQRIFSIVRGADQVIGNSAEEKKPLPRQGRVMRRQGVAFRDEVDPNAMVGPRLRIAEIRLGQYRVELGSSLRTTQAIYVATRTRLFAILAGVSLIAALGSYLVAARALSPLSNLAEEAKRLRTMSEGTLPQTGRRDEIDELANILNTLLERVRDDVRRVRQFTADAAHEIRTPLAAIRGHLELLLPRVDDATGKTLDGVLEEVGRLSRLVNQLLFLENLEVSPSTSAFSVLDLAVLVEDLLDHLRIVAAEQGLTLSSELEKATVRGDAEKLRQVFINLIDNAFKHTPRGGTVSVRLNATEDRVVAIVRDSGPGIPEESFERIFERFASDRSLTSAGSGLGLPIARAIARAHDGDLSVASPGGAEFTLTLPSATA